MLLMRRTIPGSRSVTSKKRNKEPYAASRPCLDNVAFNTKCPTKDQSRAVSARGRRTHALGVGGAVSSTACADPVLVHI